MKRWSVVILALCLASGTLVACSDEDGDAALPKAEYSERANAICAETNTRVEPIFRKHFGGDGPPTPSDMSAFARDVVPIERATLEELRDLPAPEGDEETVEEIYSSAEEATDTLERAQDDPQTARQVLEGDPFEEPERLARAYGLADCGSGE